MEVVMCPKCRCEDVADTSLLEYHIKACAMCGHDRMLSEPEAYARQEALAASSRSPDFDL